MKILNRHFVIPTDTPIGRATIYPSSPLGGVMKVFSPIVFLP